MKIFRQRDTTIRPADPATFVGPVQVTQLAGSDVGTPVHLYRVEFDSGGRTNWHTHSGPQWLLVVEGRIRVQREGEPALDVETGDAVVFEPGEKHWHGAVPGSRGVHVAVNVNFTTQWLEPVSDRAYCA